MTKDHSTDSAFGFIETFYRDLRYGARTLVRAPLFTLVVTLTLALGIGANIAIFTLVNAVMVRSLPVEKPAELYRDLLARIEALPPLAELESG
ncbi:MAG: hypothetical protein WBP34_06830 [Thermoanaerobaculia bacterium]